jgi:molybdenum cofactor biosynthesis protein B
MSERVLRFGVVVTSDRVYRGEAEDRVIPLVKKKIENKNYILSFSTIVPNNKRSIREAVLKAVAKSDIVLVTGGTGPGPRDVSVEAISGIARKMIPGIGELHRRLSLGEVGSRAFLSRTSAYVVGESLVMVSPGSPSAVELSLQVLLEVGSHAVGAIRGGSRWDKGDGEKV